jgi:FOG: EAL domain
VSAVVQASLSLPTYSPKILTPAIAASRDSLASRNGLALLRFVKMEQHEHSQTGRDYDGKYDALAADVACAEMIDAGRDHGTLLDQTDPERTAIVCRVTDAMEIQSGDAPGNQLELTRARSEERKVLGLEVVAEGIEREEQAVQLRNLNCDVVQGFLFSRPLPAEAIAELIARAGHDLAA